MKIPNFYVSSLETCISALQIWMAFFLVTAVLQFAFPDPQIEKIVILLAGAVAIGTIAYRWIVEIDARRNLANLSFLMVAFIIGLDMTAALME